MSYSDYMAGFRDGACIGFNAGYRKGFEDGYDDGYCDGRQELPYSLARRLAEAERRLDRLAPPDFRELPVTEDDSLPLGLLGTRSNGFGKFAAADPLLPTPTAWPDDY